MNDRIFTLLVFLDTLEEGQTVFTHPDVNSAINPKRGTALLYRNFGACVGFYVAVLSIYLMGKFQDVEIIHMLCGVKQADQISAICARCTGR